MAEKQLTLAPIGVVRTAATTRAEAARQPPAAPENAGRIELYRGRNFEHALQDLDGWGYIWVLFWFHLNKGWRPKVLPPRSPGARRGVFATRAPHRPNPLGLSALRLDRVDGLTLHVRGVDMLDGTPVLDIKPYVAYSDAHPEASSGWLDATAQRPAPGTPADPVAPFAVRFEPLAEVQAAWIEDQAGPGIRARITTTLALGPQPHPYRRIRRVAGGLRLAVQDWRVEFAVTGTLVQVRCIRSGYRAAELSGRTRGAAVAPAIHRAFVARWPGTTP